MTDVMFPKRLDRLEILCAMSSPIVEAFLVGLIAKCTCLDVPGTGSSTMI